jgi:hypothetical protein
VSKPSSGGRTRGRSRSLPLAPGAAIEVSSGDRSRCGIAAVLDLDGDPHLLTCGHSFKSSSGRVFEPSSAAPIATLTRSLFDDAEPLDAAVCKLTDHGKDLLDHSAGAGSWFDRIHTPSAADNGDQVAFWPTNEDDPDPIDLSVTSFSARIDHLFGSGRPQDGFIQIQFPAIEGDSGSVLALDDAYYGLCSGTAGSSSYFTPIAAIVAALRNDFGSIQLWQSS